MFESLILAIGLTAPDYTASVAVTAAYTLKTAKQVEVSKCCGACKNGIVTHGDGHKTPCPCPPDCKCKAKSTVCESGTCTLKR